MTVQTLWGYTQMYVYETGRELLEIGVVPLDNMLPETALMKLSWVLAHTDDRDEVMRRMRRPVNHETTPREPHNGYLIMQVGCRRPRSTSPTTGSERQPQTFTARILSAIPCALSIREPRRIVVEMRGTPPACSVSWMRLRAPKITS